MSPPVFDEYLKTTGKPIEASIRGELSGDFEKLMLAVGKLDASAWPRDTGSSQARSWGREDAMELNSPCDWEWGSRKVRYHLDRGYSRGSPGVDCPGVRFKSAWG